MNFLGLVYKRGLSCKAEHYIITVMSGSFFSTAALYADDFTLSQGAGEGISLGRFSFLGDEDQSIFSFTPDGFEEDRISIDSQALVWPLDTSVGLTFEPYENARKCFDEEYRIRLWTEFAEKPAVSQDAFWRFQKCFFSDWLDVRVPELERRSRVLHAIGHFLLHASKRYDQTRLVLSARKRLEFIEHLSDVFKEGDRELTRLSTLKRTAVELVRKEGTVQTVFKNPVLKQSAPSTEKWVHGFMLWTGAPPPVAVRSTLLSQRSNVTARLSGGHLVSHRRSQISRHRQRHINWRAQSVHRKGDFQNDALAACGYDAGRHQRLRGRFDSSRWQAYDSRNWEMGNYFRAGSRPGFDEHSLGENW